MAEVGWAGLGILPVFGSDFGRELERGSSKHLAAAGASGGTTFGDAAGKSAGKRFGGVFKTAAKAALVGLAGAGALAFKLGKDAVGAASDLNEVVSKTEQIFGGKALSSLEKFAETADEGLGQSKQSALEAISTFGIMGKVAGLEGNKLGKFATGLTTLSSDLASFGNTSPEEAIEAIGSALRGEAEPIRKYGVLLDEATLKAEALALGILKPVKDQAKIESYHVRVIEGQKKYNDAVAEFGPKSLEALKAEAALGTAQAGLQKATEGTIGTLTSQQKVLAAQSAIMKQTSDAQGDFTRTSDGLANQQRILAARFDNAKAKLGVGLLPIVTDAAKFLNDTGVPAFERFSDWFNRKGIPAIGNFADEVRPLGKSLLPAVGDALGTVRDVLKPAAGYAKDLVDAFNDMPDWAKTAIVGGGAGLLVGKKLGLGSLAGKAAGSLASKSTPIPVFVVNEGFGGAGAGSTGKAGRLKTAAKWGGPAAAVAFLGEPLVTGRGKEDFEGGFGGVGAGGVADAAAKFDKLGDKVETSGKSIGLLRDASDKLYRRTDLGADRIGEATNYFRDGLFAATRAAEQAAAAFTASVQANNALGGEGSTAGQPPGRSGGVVINHNGNIVANSPRDYTRDMQRRSRNRAGGGVDFD